MNVAPGTNTFNWDGSGMPNGTYWVYTVVRGGGGVGTGYSTGPVRIERPVPPTPELLRAAEPVPACSTPARARAATTRRSPPAHRPR